MKIAAIMATRNNPHRAAAVMECANSLASGKNEIEWQVCCDRDDKKTLSYFANHYPSIAVSIGDAPLGVGSVWNRGAANTDAAIIAPFPDDSFPGLPNWDATIVDSLPDPGQIGVIAWNDTANPNQCTLPVITRRWYELAGLYDERFPFWFYDTCVAELWSFVSGRAASIPKHLLLAAKKGKTKSMRDLEFWWKFYSATRTERVKKAAEIRDKIGVDISTDLLRNVIETWEARDAIASKHFEALERDLSAAVGEPDQRYLMAKAAAKTYLEAA